MTASHDSTSMYEERASTLGGALGLAAARLALSATRLLSAAKRESGLSQKQLSDRLEVSEGRVSQVFNGDGNMMLATLARFMHVMGYAVDIVATPLDSGRKPLKVSVGRQRRGATVGGTRTRVDYAVYEQQFLTGHGPMTFEMFVPTDDVLGCVPEGGPRKRPEPVSVTPSSRPRPSLPLASRAVNNWRTQPPAVSAVTQV